MTSIVTDPVTGEKKYTTTNETDGSTEPVTKNETTAAPFIERRHLSRQLPLINRDEGKGDEDEEGEEDDVGEEDVEIEWEEDIEWVEDDDGGEVVDGEEGGEEGQEYFPSINNKYINKTINGTDGTTEPVPKYETTEPVPKYETTEPVPKYETLRTY